MPSSSGSEVRVADPGLAIVGHDRPQELQSASLAVADAMQGLAESLETSGPVVSLRQLASLHSWLSLFEDDLPQSVKGYITSELRGLQRYLTQALLLGSATGAKFALCKQEWEEAARPLSKQLLATGDLLRLQAGAPANATCRRRACRAWALLHGLAAWKSEASKDFRLVEHVLKARNNRHVPNQVEEYFRSCESLEEEGFSASRVSSAGFHHRACQNLSWSAGDRAELLDAFFGACPGTCWRGSLKQPGILAYLHGYVR